MWWQQNINDEHVETYSRPRLSFCHTRQEFDLTLKPAKVIYPYTVQPNLYGLTIFQAKLVYPNLKQTKLVYSSSIR